MAKLATAAAVALSLTIITVVTVAGVVHLGARRARVNKQQRDQTMHNVRYLQIGRQRAVPAMCALAAIEQPAARP
jgi:hypothetical protein